VRGVAERWITVNTDLREAMITSFDGTKIALRHSRLHDGPTALLVHGFAVDSEMNWQRSGIAAHLIARGCAVAMFDLRGHGRSDQPADPTRYLDDAMARDLLCVVAALSLERWHLMGYSLGAIISARALMLGAQPTSVVLGGMGDRLVDPSWARPPALARALRGEPVDGGALAAGEVEGFLAFVAATGGDALALSAVQGAHRATTVDEWATWQRVPTLVLAGYDDDVNGDPAELASVITGSTLMRTPGNHLSALQHLDFASALADWAIARDRQST
jgi:pimeloyl-ACP methyl ester carboxylesterase